jgi:hypothetical protein
MTFVALLVFAIAFAIVTGNRLSAEALPIALGVAVGVAVGIPTSVLLAAFMARQVMASIPAQQNVGTGSKRNPASSAPHTGNGKARSRPVSPQIEHQAMPVASGRQFTVVGGASAPLLEEDSFVGN